jgi:hypothetical protein
VFHGHVFLAADFAEEGLAGLAPLIYEGRAGVESFVAVAFDQELAAEGAASRSQFVTLEVEF